MKCRFYFGTITKKLESYSVMANTIPDSYHPDLLAFAAEIDDIIPAFDMGDIQTAVCFNSMPVKTMCLPSTEGIEGSGSDDCVSIASGGTTPKKALKKRILKCQYCVLTFLTRESCIKHVKEIHPSVPIKKCSLCDMEFYNTYGYSSHIKTHSEKRGFKCLQCEFTCKHQPGVTQHLKRVHCLQPIKNINWAQQSVT